MLLQEVKSVLEDYNTEYSSYAVEKTLENWKDAKTPLINILSKHPHWNDNLKCVILTYQENRGNGSRYSKFQDLKNYVSREIVLTSEIIKILNEFLTSDLSQFLDNSLINCIDNISTSFKFKAGQKISRAVNKIFATVGADNLPEYNKLFAQFSDSVNPLKIDRTAVLSVNPIDYLLMSNGTGWKSCHNLNDGCHKAGTMSYMCDETSMIFFTIENNEDEIQLATKITRNVFCYSDGKLLQSRLYPDNNEDLKQNYRQIVQSIFADCLELPNIWRLEKNFDTINENIRTYDYSLHYLDYSYDSYNPNISFLKDFESSSERILIGSNSYCIECGSRLNDSDSLSCCTSSYNICDGCGCRVDEDDAIWVDGSAYCSGCVSCCARCGEYTRGSITEVAGRYDYVCGSCLEEFYTYCEDCETYVINDDATYIENEDKYVCDSCLSSNYFYCDTCEEYHSNDDKNEHEGDFYCNDCFSEKYFTCEECGAIYSNDEKNTHVGNGNCYCDECFDNLVENLEENLEVEKEVC
jgi:hypothetical protein